MLASQLFEVRYAVFAKICDDISLIPYLKVDIEVRQPVGLELAEITGVLVGRTT